MSESSGGDHLVPRSRWISTVRLGPLALVAMATAACPAIFCRPDAGPLKVAPVQESRRRAQAAQVAGPLIPESKPVPGQAVRVRLMAGERQLSLHTRGPVQFHHAQGNGELPPGVWTITAAQATPARQRFHVFIKTFKLHESDAAQQYLCQWKAQGYKPELVTFGRRFRTDSATTLDNQIHWVSLARFTTEPQALELKAQLEKQNVWAWIRPETIAPGTAVLAIRDASGKGVIMGPAPLRFDAAEAISLSNVASGLWREQRGNHSYTGDLETRIGPDGLLEIYETLPLEEYLCGVLPAEMPALWPLEALKAQALAARSGVVADLAGKHYLEGFDFCSTEHCRVYAGYGGRQEATDKAVAATARQVLVAGGRVIPAVFSANCGGWTENNDTVWSAPPDAVLRGVPDFPQGANPASQGPVQFGIERWLKSSPPAFCSSDTKNFRWIRQFTTAELGEAVNKRYPVGAVRAIELGPRGVSGRLKWVRVVGSEKTVTIHKDLPIRLAFGGLPSALFTVATTTGRHGPESFTFIGGGRGHGVGLCQHGARGMALAGATYMEIVAHYFTGVRIARIGYR